MTMPIAPITADIGPFTGFAPGYHKRLKPVIAANGFSASLTVPGGEVWTLEAFTATITTSAAVGNRFAKLAATDADGNLLWSVDSGATLAASSTQGLAYVKGYSARVPISGGTSTLQVPDLLLRASDVVTLSIVLPLAGDAVSAPFAAILVQREGSHYYPTGRGIAVGLGTEQDLLPPNDPAEYGSRAQVTSDWGRHYGNPARTGDQR